MLKIGITGGIGSGKTTVCRIFSSLGVAVFNADEAAKKILHENKAAQRKIKKIFGKKILGRYGVINRKKLAKLVFENSGFLGNLNSVIHPMVLKVYQSWLKQRNHHPYTLKEAAILFESAAHKNLDGVIMVFAPEKIRIKRVMLRDRTTQREVVTRIRNQWSDEKKIKLAQFVIYNDGTKMILPQVLKIHNKLCNLTY